MYYCDVERDCLQADGDEPAGDWVTSHDSDHDVLVNKIANTMLVFILVSTEENLVSFLCCCFAKVSSISFHRFQGCSLCICPLRVTVPGVSPQLLSVLVFPVPMVMLSLPRIFDDAPVACLTPPSWHTVMARSLIRAATDPV